MRTSELLARLAGEPNDRLTVGTILTKLGDRSFSLLVVILGLPNCIPMPPPIPLVCAFLLFGVAIQIALGRSAPWAPSFVMARSVAQKDVQRAANTAIPMLLKLERFSQPRLQWFGHSRAALVIGLLLMALALGLLTAAPFIGQIPWGLAVCLLGLGLVERDGVLVIAACVLGCVGALLSAGFVYAVFVGLKNLF